MSRRNAQQGFTLLEMLIALAIVAMMMFVAYSVTAQIGGDKKFVAKVADRNHELRVGMTRMVHDISMSYLSQNEKTDILEPRTVFMGKRSGEAILQFSSFAHRVMWADANESEQTMISYFTAPDPYDRQTTNLVRRETRRMTDEGYDSEKAEIDVLVHNIEEIEFEYWNWRDNDWQSEWDSTNDSERGRLPTRVRIKLTVMGRNRKPIVHTTQARIMMEERLQFFTN
jgi:type II secretion system protein J